MKFTGERMIPRYNIGEEIYTEHLNRYIFASKITKGKLVLDIACGSGYGTDILSKSGAKFVYGVDISKESIKDAKEHYKSKNIHFLVGNVIKIPINSHTVDVVVSFETIEHISEKDQTLFMEEIKRVIKPNGVLIMSTPNPIRSVNKNRFHIKELTIKEYNHLLSKNFKYNQLLYQDNLKSNYILNESGMKNENLLQALEAGVHNIYGLVPKKSAYIMAVSSNIKFPVTKGTISISDSSEKDKLMEEINRMNFCLSQKDSVIQQREKEIMSMKSSKFWKAREFCLSVMKRLGIR